MFDPRAKRGSALQVNGQEKSHRLSSPYTGLIIQLSKSKIDVPHKRVKLSMVIGLFTQPGINPDNSGEYMNQLVANHVFVFTNIFVTKTLAGSGFALDRDIMSNAEVWLFSCV